jgi:proteasome lid subunit RPN8/RPN11
MTLILGSEVERALVDAARAAWPAEFVALLGSRRGAPDAVTAWVRLPNRAPLRDRFEVHASDFATAEARLRHAQHEFLGFAHSHPNGIAALSATDRATLWTGCVHLVVAVAADGACVLSAHRLDDDRGTTTMAIVRALAGASESLR